MKIRCAWCGEEYNETKEGEGETSTICPTCKAEQLALVETIEREPDPPTIDELQGKRNQDEPIPFLGEPMVPRVITESDSYF